MLFLVKDSIYAFTIVWAFVGRPHYFKVTHSLSPPPPPPKKDRLSKERVASWNAWARFQQLWKTCVGNCEVSLEGSFLMIASSVFVQWLILNLGFIDFRFICVLRLTQINSGKHWKMCPRNECRFKVKLSEKQAEERLFERKCLWELEFCVERTSSLC